jgi:hypothetical protein
MMRRLAACGVLLVALAGLDTALDAQARRTQPRAQTRKPAPAARPPAPVTAPAVITCPDVLGEGVATKRSYCDVTIGRDPAAGVIIDIPPHRGTVMLSFDLHNRHTYSEDEIRAKRGYRRYTATLGVLAMDNTLLSRAVIQSEFRTAADLVDRISGGVGPGGVKAVAPTGVEPIGLVIEEQAERVSLRGEKINIVTVDEARGFTAAGRPVAVISNVMLTYTPAPPPPAAPATRKPATTRQ